MILLERDRRLQIFPDNDVVPHKLYSHVILAGITTCLTVVSTASIAKAQSVIDNYFTIQPIQVCNDSGLDCAPIPLFAEEVEKIFNQAGVAPIFLPTTQLNNTNFLQTTGVKAINQAGSGQHSNSTTINAWFVDELISAPGSIRYGNAFIGANGSVINGTAVQNYNSGNGRRDTLAHEIGHNFGLGHEDFGAGGSNNLMTSGSNRTTPDSLANITPDGASLSQLTTAQINQILSSPFLNAIPEVVVDTNGSTPYDTDDFFLVDFQDGPSNIFLESLSLDLSPVNAFFDSIGSSSDFNFLGDAGSPFALSNLNGVDTSDITLLGNNASLDGKQKLTLNFAPNSFTLGDSFRFGLDIDLFDKIDNFGATPEELIGSLFSFTFSDGLRLKAETGNDLIASSIKPTTFLSFSGQPTGGSPISPGTIASHFDPEPVPEPNSVLMYLGLIGTGLFYFRQKKRLSS